MWEVFYIATFFNVIVLKILQTRLQAAYKKARNSAKPKIQKKNEMYNMSASIDCSASNFSSTKKQQRYCKWHCFKTSDMSAAVN